MYIIIQVPKKYSHDSFIASPRPTESDTTEVTWQQKLQPEKKKNNSWHRSFSIIWEKDAVVVEAMLQIRVQVLLGGIEGGS